MDWQIFGAGEWAILARKKRKKGRGEVQILKFSPHVNGANGVLVGRRGGGRRHDLCPGPPRVEDEHPMDVAGRRGQPPRSAPPHRAKDHPRRMACSSDAMVAGGATTCALAHRVSRMSVRWMWLDGEANRRAPPHRAKDQPRRMAVSSVGRRGGGGDHCGLCAGSGEPRNEAVTH